jgi:2-dehydro-3-deoxygluconokinase
MDVVTLGETMVAFRPEEPGPLTYVDGFRRGVGGAESNMAMALERLGHDTAWHSRVGDDPFGRYVRNFVRGEGVETRVEFDHHAPTGVLFKERREAGESRVYYYRQDSAASRMGPEDLPATDVADAEWLHLTGITPALSTSCRELVEEAARHSDEHDAKLSLDPNLRHRLWTEAAMRETLVPMMEHAEVVMPGVEEGETLFGTDDPDRIADATLEAGADVALVKLGAEGALMATDDDRERVPGYPVEEVVDPVGAGDGFAAGFISGQLRGDSLVQSVQRANAVGAFATTVTGDVEGFPTADELDRFIEGEEGVTR